MTVSDAVAAAMGEAAPQAAGPAAAESSESSMLPAGRYLVATRTCPNCKHAAAQMDQAGIAYEELLAEENVELAQRFRIMQAPTLLEVSADGTVDITAGAAAVFQKINALRAPGGGVRALSSRQPALPVDQRAYRERTPSVSHTSSKRPSAGPDRKTGPASRLGADGDLPPRLATV